MIEIIDLYKFYVMGMNILYVFKGIDFIVNEGEFVVIMGFLGFGKFILFNIFGMLDEVD